MRRNECSLCFSLSLMQVVLHVCFCGRTALFFLQERIGIEWTPFHSAFPEAENLTWKLLYIIIAISFRISGCSRYWGLDLMVSTQPDSSLISGLLDFWNLCRCVFKERLGWTEMDMWYKLCLSLSNDHQCSKLQNCPRILEIHFNMPVFLDKLLHLCFEWKALLCT